MIRAHCDCWRRSSHARAAGSTARTAIAFAFVVLALLWATPAAVAAGNLLANPGFEEPLAPEGVPTGWARYGGGRTDTDVRASFDPRTGKQALLLFDQAGNVRETAYAIGVWQELPAEPGARYLARVWAKTISRSEDRAVILRLRFVPSDRESVIPVFPKPDRGYQETHLLAQAPPDTTALRFYVYGANFARSETLIDDCSLEALTDAEYEKFRPVEPFGSSGIVEPYPLRRQTVLAADGAALASIFTASGEEYLELAQGLQRHLQLRTGAQLPIIADLASLDLKARPSVIALGNMTNNPVIERLYCSHETRADAGWPGKDQPLLETVNDPYAFPNARDIVIAGGVGVDETEQAIEGLAERVEPGREAVLPWQRAEPFPPGPEGPRGNPLDFVKVSYPPPHDPRNIQSLREDLLALAEEFGRPDARELTPQEIGAAGDVFLAWAKTEGLAEFSNDDRARIANLMLGLLYRLPAYCPEWHRLGGQPFLPSAETAAVLSGIYYGARYFCHRYGDLDWRMREMLAKVKAGFEPQFASYKSRADHRTPQGIILSSTLDYALAEWDLRPFQDDLVRRWRDWSAAVWFEWSLDNAFYAPSTPRLVVPPTRMPDAGWVPAPNLRVLPLTRAVYELPGAERPYGAPGNAMTVALDRALDKLAFRYRDEEQGLTKRQSLFLDGYGRGDYGAYDTNAITGYDSWLSRPPDERRAGAHSSITLARNGLAPDTVPPAAGLLHAGDFGRDALTCTVARAYNGADWYRNIVWLKGEYFLVLDQLTAQEKGDFLADCHWHPAEPAAETLPGGSLRVSRPVVAEGVTRARDLFVLSAVPLRTELRTVERAYDDHRTTTRLHFRQRQEATLAPGESLTFQNLLFSQDGGEEPKYDFARLDQYAVVVRGTEHVALAGLRGAAWPADDVKLGADLFYVLPDRIAAAGLEEITWGPRLMDAKGRCTVELDLATGALDVNADEKVQLRVIGKPESEVRMDDKLVRAHYTKAGLLAFDVPQGHHAIQIAPWVPDQALMARIRSDLLSLRAPIPVTPPAPRGQTRNAAELWRLPTAGDPLADACVADLDGNGLDEVLIPRGSVLHCLSATGEQTWSFPARSAILAVAAGAGLRPLQPAVLVLTEEGDLEILNGQGEQVRSSDARLPLRFSRPASATALIAEGADDAASGLVLATNWGTAALCDVALRAKWEQTVPYIGRRPSVAAADLTGDGHDEVLVGAGDGKVHVFTADGKPLTQLETEPGVTTLAVGDLDGDRIPEVIFGSPAGVTVAQAVTGGPKWVFRNYDYGPTSITIADADADGQDEVLLTSESGHLYVLGANGEVELMLPAEGPVNCALVGKFMDRRRTIIAYAGDDGCVRLQESDRELRGEYWHGRPIVRLLAAQLDKDDERELIAADDEGTVIALKYDRGAGT